MYIQIEQCHRQNTTGPLLQKVCQNVNMNYTESTCTTDYSGIISLLEVQVSRFLHGVRHTPLSLLKACFQLPDTSLYSSIGIKNSIRPVWRKSLYPSMSIDILTVNRGIKNSCILSRRKSLMACIIEFWAIIAFLLNNPFYGNRLQQTAAILYMETGCSRQQQSLQSIIWRQVVVDSSNPLYENRL